MALGEKPCIEAATGPVMGEAPVGDHQVDGNGKSIMMDLQCQLRVLENALESRI